MAFTVQLASSACFLLEEGHRHCNVPFCHSFTSCYHAFRSQWCDLSTVLNRSPESALCPPEGHFPMLFVEQYQVLQLLYRLVVSGILSNLGPLTKKRACHLWGHCWVRRIPPRVSSLSAAIGWWPQHYSSKWPDLYQHGLVRCSTRL